MVPDAKAATARLRGLIDTKLITERDAGTSAINDLESKIKDLPAFKKLSADDQNKVLTRSTEAKETIHTGRFITSVRDRISRYRSQDYPAQLTLVDQLIAAASPKVQEGGKAAPAPIKCVPLSELHVKSSLPYIGTSEELDDYLQLLRAAALEEIKKGNRVTL